MIARAEAVGVENDDGSACGCEWILLALRIAGEKSAADIRGSNRDGRTPLRIAGAIETREWLARVRLRAVARLAEDGAVLGDARVVALAAHGSFAQAIRGQFHNHACAARAAIEAQRVCAAIA